jgi:hypothetical protein
VGTGRAHAHDNPAAAGKTSLQFETIHSQIDAAVEEILA